jgi:hypothetical protein
MLKFASVGDYIEDTQMGMRWRQIRRGIQNAMSYKYIVAAFLLTVVLPSSGVFLLFDGIAKYDSAIYEKRDRVFNTITIIAGGNDSEIASMMIFADKHQAIERGEGWMGCTIDFTSNDQVMALEFLLKKEIKYVHALNYTSCLYFNYSWSYSGSFSTLNVAYASFSNETHIRILFDWRILERTDYDKEVVSVSFSNPFFYNDLYKEHYPIGNVYYPVIRELVIDIHHDWNLFSPLTIPQPTQLLFEDYGGWQETSVCWIFDFDKDISSVQAAFQSAALSSERDAVIFRSGLYQAFGISMIIGGITDALLLLRKYLLRRKQEKSKHSPLAEDYSV